MENNKTGSKNEAYGMLIQETLRQYLTAHFDTATHSGHLPSLELCEFQLLIAILFQSYSKDTTFSVKIDEFSPFVTFGVLFRQ